MQETVAEVITELQAFLNGALATQAYAALGLFHERELLQGIPITAENPDPTIHIGVADPNELFAPYSRWRLSEARRQLAQGGLVEQRLSQQWIVYTYTAWEHEFRPRLEKAHGREEGTLKVPLLGELRQLRNDVVHHYGIATEQHSGKCEVLAHWVSMGSPIHVTPERFAEFWNLFPWFDLEVTPSSNA